MNNKRIYELRYQLKDTGINGFKRSNKLSILKNFVKNRKSDYFFYHIDVYEHKKSGTYNFVRRIKLKK